MALRCTPVSSARTVTVAPPNDGARRACDELRPVVQEPRYFVANRHDSPDLRSIIDTLRDRRLIGQIRCRVFRDETGGDRRSGIFGRPSA